MRGNAVPWTYCGVWVVILFFLQELYSFKAPFISRSIYDCPLYAWCLRTFALKPHSPPPPIPTPTVPSEWVCSQGCYGYYSHAAGSNATLRHLPLITKNATSEIVHAINQFVKQATLPLSPNTKPIFAYDMTDVLDQPPISYNYLIKNVNLSHIFDVQTK